MASVRKRTWKSAGKAQEAWVVSYTDQQGKRRTKTFPSKKAAGTYRNTVETEVDNKTHIPESQSPTVAQYSDEFLRISEDRKRDGRIGQGRLVNLRRTIDNSIKRHLGATKLCNLTARQIEDFYTAMCREDGLAPTTARTRVVDLRAMLDVAIRRRYLRDNPATEALKALRGIPPVRVRTFTAEQVSEILRVAGIRERYSRERSTRLRECFVHLAALCGLRLGEIMALKAENIDFDRRMVQVRHSVTLWDELKGPKTRSGVRDVPLPSHVAEMIKRWLATHLVPEPRGLIFRSEKGTMIRHWVFREWYWLPLLVKAGLDNKGDQLHFHALRHFAASWMIENGMPITDVAVLMGHSKFDMTLQVYAHPVVAGNRRHDVLEQMSSGVLLPPLLPQAQILDATKPA